jgi:hypothetical protein
MRWPWRKKLPEPPQGVRLCKPDGTVVPIETVYQGKKNGLHEWAMIMPYHFDPRTEHLEIALMPARSAVTFWLESEELPTGFRVEEQ